jgi:hypothetical protein
VADLENRANKKRKGPKKSMNLKLDCPLCDYIPKSKQTGLPPKLNKDKRRNVRMHYFKEHLPNGMKTISTNLDGEIGFACDCCEFFSVVLYSSNAVQNHTKERRAKLNLASHYMTLHQNRIVRKSNN